MSPFRKAVNSVRKKFFPRWDLKRSWKICLIPSRTGSECCSREKRIEIRSLPNWTGPDARLELIHEFCHAVAREMGEGVKWQKRMLSAAARAKKQGEKRLASLLHKEVRRYRKTRKYRLKHLREEIENLAMEPVRPAWSNAKRELASRLGMRVADFGRRYPTARKSYEQALKDFAQ